MRMRRDMLSSFVELSPRPRVPPSQPELLPNDARHLTAVRPPPGLAHDMADDDPDGLHVPRAELRHDVGIGVEGLLDDRRELVARADRSQALRLGDPRPVS